jgi:hypothetical protein
MKAVGKPFSPRLFIERCRAFATVHSIVRVVAYEDVFLLSPDRYVQRIVAVKTNSHLERFAR